MVNRQTQQFGRRFKKSWFDVILLALKRLLVVRLRQNRRCNEKESNILRDPILGKSPKLAHRTILHTHACTIIHAHKLLTGWAKNGANGSNAVNLLLLEPGAESCNVGIVCLFVSLCGSQVKYIYSNCRDTVDRQERLGDKPKKDLDWCRCCLFVCLLLKRWSCFVVVGSSIAVALPLPWRRVSGGGGGILLLLPLRCQLWWVLSESKFWAKDRHPVPPENITAVKVMTSSADSGESGAGVLHLRELRVLRWVVVRERDREVVGKLAYY